MRGEPLSHEAADLLGLLDGQAVAAPLEEVPGVRHALRVKRLLEQRGALRRNRRVGRPVQDQERGSNAGGHARRRGGGIDRVRDHASRRDRRCGDLVRCGGGQGDGQERAHAVPVKRDALRVHIRPLAQELQAGEAAPDVLGACAGLREVEAAPAILPAAFAGVGVVGRDADEAPIDQVRPARPQQRLGVAAHAVAEDDGGERSGALGPQHDAAQGFPVRRARPLLAAESKPLDAGCRRHVRPDSGGTQDCERQDERSAGETPFHALSPCTPFKREPCAIIAGLPVSPVMRFVAAMASGRTKRSLTAVWLMRRLIVGLQWQSPGRTGMGAGKGFRLKRVEGVVMMPHEEAAHVGERCCRKAVDRVNVQNSIMTPMPPLRNSLTPYLTFLLRFPTLTFFI